MLLAFSKFIWIDYCGDELRCVFRLKHHLRCNSRLLRVRVAPIDLDDYLEFCDCNATMMTCCKKIPPTLSIVFKY